MVKTFPRHRAPGSRSHPGPPGQSPHGTNVIVIGAGHNGLIAACYLAQAGLDVTVLEAAPEIGGCTTSFTPIAEAPHHRVVPCALDICLMRATTVVRDLNLDRFGYTEIDIDPFYVFLDPDGGSIAFWNDPRRTAEEIGRFSRKDAESFLRLARAVDAATGALLPMMLTSPTRPEPAKLSAAVRGMARNGRQVLSLRSLLQQTAFEAIDAWFEHPLVRGGLSVVATGAGLPITADRTGAFLGFLGFLHRLGTGRPLGGMQALPDALARCLAAAGGRVRISCPVEQILVRGKAVTGVRLTTGEVLEAQAVMASCDPKTTLTRLLPAGVLSDRHAARVARIKTANQGMAFLRMDLALGGQSFLSRHEAWRGDGLDLRKPSAFIGDLEGTLAATEEAQRGLLPESFPFIGNLTTGLDPSLAPDGQDVLYLWSSTMPAHPPEGWGSLAERAAKTMVTQAAGYFDGIEQLELGRWVETWPDLVGRIGASDGNPYHVDFTEAGPLRPAVGFAGYRTPVPGLFLTGAGTHPGGTVTGIPGQLAARALLRDRRR